MKRLLLVCAILPLVLSASVTGQWRAMANVVIAGKTMPQTIGIYATLTEAGNTVTGTAGTNGKTKAIQNVVVSGSQVRFSVPEGTGNTSFVLVDTGAPTLSGTVTLSTGQILPVTFKSVK